MTRPLPQPPSVTYEELCALPDNLVGEIVAGELFASPRPGPRHVQASTEIAADLASRYRKSRDDDGPGGWRILLEPELHLGDHVLVPDVAGWHRERLPRLPDTAYFSLAPNWVCEVVSPSTGGVDRVRKMPAYAEQGVSYAWLVDPLSRSLEVFCLNPERLWVLIATHHGEQTIRAEPFSELEIELAFWWAQEESGED